MNKLIQFLSQSIYTNKITVAQYITACELIYLIQLKGWKDFKNPDTLDIIDNELVIKWTSCNNSNISIVISPTTLTLSKASSINSPINELRLSDQVKLFFKAYFYPELQKVFQWDKLTKDQEDLSHGGLVASFAD